MVECEIQVRNHRALKESSIIMGRRYFHTIPYKEVACHGNLKSMEENGKEALLLGLSETNGNKQNGHSKISAGKLLENI